MPILSENNLRNCQTERAETTKRTWSATIRRPAAKLRWVLSGQFSLVPKVRRTNSSDWIKSDRWISGTAKDFFFGIFNLEFPDYSAKPKRSIRQIILNNIITVDTSLKMELMCDRRIIINVNDSFYFKRSFLWRLNQKQLMKMPIPILFWILITTRIA